MRRFSSRSTHPGQLQGIRFQLPGKANSEQMKQKHQDEEGTFIWVSQCPILMYTIYTYVYIPGDSDGKASACNAGDLGSTLGQEDPLKKEMAIHFSTLAWKIPWTEEPGGQQSKGSQRVRHDWATSLYIYTHTYIHNICICIFIYITIIDLWKIANVEQKVLVPYSSLS